MHILTYSEQGMGDAIQMARFLPLMYEHEQCDALTVMCHASLVALFTGQARGRWTVLPMEAEPPAHDLWLGFMSLPAYLGTTLVTVPPPADYGLPRACDRCGGAAWVCENHPDRPWGGLSADARACNCGAGAPCDWCNPSRPRRVALCTQGGKVASLDKDRSDHTGSLASLTDLPGVEWIDFTGRVGDWLDTAHELATCDLCISVDSALAHLAGSLRIETWLVPPTHWEWRWTDPRVLRARGLDPDGSVWYPHHRLYRRADTRDWPNVTARIRRDLATRLEARHACAVAR